MYEVLYERVINIYWPFKDPRTSRMENFPTAPQAEDHRKRQRLPGPCVDADSVWGKCPPVLSPWMFVT